MAFAGKENYMALEVRMQKRYTYKCDIFSLGVLLMYLCTKRENYKGMIISNFVEQDESHYLQLESEYKAFEDILNKMIRYN